MCARFANSFARKMSLALCWTSAVVMTLAIASHTALAREAKPAVHIVASENREEGPLQMLVSLKEQQIKVYQGTQLLTSSPVSSGKKGHSTPTGVFSILEKRRKHFSNLYNDAPMPYMQRLTWSGIALHQGRIPGYPASHGCVRLPAKFAKSLFGMTEHGVHVIVTKGEASPRVIHHPALLQPYLGGMSVASLSAGTIAADPALRGSILSSELQASLPPRQEVNRYFDHPLRMIITRRAPESPIHVLQRLLDQMGFNPGPVDGVLGRKTRDAIRLFQEGQELPVTGNVTDGLRRAVYQAANYRKPLNGLLKVRRKFKDVYQAEVTLKEADKPFGTHVFTALDFRQGDSRIEWMAVSAEQDEIIPSAEDVLDRLVFPDRVRREVGRMLTPGTSMIITDRSYLPNTGLGTDFVVLTK